VFRLLWREISQYFIKNKQKTLLLWNLAFSFTSEADIHFACSKKTKSDYILYQLELKDLAWTERIKEHWYHDILERAQLYPNHPENSNENIIQLFTTFQEKRVVYQKEPNVEERTKEVLEQLQSIGLTNIQPMFYADYIHLKTLNTVEQTVACIMLSLFLIDYSDYMWLRYHYSYEKRLESQYFSAKVEMSWIQCAHDIMNSNECKKDRERIQKYKRKHYDSDDYVE
jgi:hypothetical protein